MSHVYLQLLQVTAVWPKDVLRNRQSLLTRPSPKRFLTDNVDNALGRFLDQLKVINSLQTKHDVLMSKNHKLTLTQALQVNNGTTTHPICPDHGIFEQSVPCRL